MSSSDWSITKETDRYISAIIQNEKKSFSLRKIAAIKTDIYEAIAVGKLETNQLESKETITCNLLKLTGCVFRGGMPHSDYEGNLQHVSVEFKLETDLPDDTKIIGRIHRTFTATIMDMGVSKTDTYSDDYAELDCTVNDLLKPSVFHLDRQKWIEAFKQSHKRLSITSDGVAIDGIDQNIAIQISVSSVQRNPRFGKYNANLVGKAISPGLLGKTVECTLYVPHVEPLPVKLPRYTHFETLQVGKKYIISKTIPLMLINNPQDWVDVAEAIAEAGEIIANGTIMVTAKTKRETTVWYRVIAWRADGRRLGDGWVNSLALCGQKIIESD